LPKGQFFLKLQIGIAADMQTVTEMLNNPMYTFRQGIKADLKPLRRKISQVIVHSSDP